MYQQWVNALQYYSRVTEYTQQGITSPTDDVKSQNVSRRKKQHSERSPTGWGQGSSHDDDDTAVSDVPAVAQLLLLTLGQHVVYLSSSTRAFSVRARWLSCWRQVLNAAPIRPWIKRTSALMGWLRGNRVLKRSRINALLLRQATQHSHWRALAGWQD